MQTFDIYFLGEMLPDADPAGVRRGVARLFKIEEPAAERLFSGNPLRVKQAIDAESASRYRSAFREVGALIQIVPSGSPPPAPRAVPTVPPAAARDTGAPAPVKQQTAPSSAAAPAALGDAGLAEPGAIIDPTPPPPPAEIDTGSLEALPPNSGSLEDCHIEKPHRPIPDISHLKLVDN